ncbi:MAG: hypothetical protein Q9220_003354 [cf. Caloplaca sp. 1 TL-2023]
MDIAGTTLTILSTTRTLAVDVKKLIQSIKQYDETVKELEAQMDTLASILGEALRLYGHDEVSQYSASEQRTRHALKVVVVRCNKDLTKFETKLMEMKGAEKWAQKAYRQATVAPEIAKLKEIRQTLKSLANRSTINDAPGTINEDILSITETLIGAEDAGAQNEEGRRSNGDTENTPLKTDEVPEQDPKGLAILKAIEEDDTDAFESLVRDSHVSLREKDSKGRTPLLLAAHLDKADMVKPLLDQHTNAEGEERPLSETSNQPTDLVAPQTSDNGGQEKDIRSDQHVIDPSATDALGRTALHYCAEFDMDNSAKVLLDRGVDVNARDSADLPAMYYAVDHRQHDATSLLLERGATTDFELPETSHEIKQLLEKTTSSE